MSEPPARERGAATVLLVCLLTLLLVVTGAVLAVSRVAVARAKVSAAADLAALAAASAGECSAATTVAAANGGVLASCEAVGPDFQVSVSLPVVVLSGRELTLSAQARAGPPD